MKFTCTHYVNTPPDAVGQHIEHIDCPVNKSALLLVDVYGLLLPKAHPARQALVKIYGSKEIKHRETLVRNNLLPVMCAARAVGMPLIYLADSAPNIGMEKTHIRDLMVRNLHIDPVTYYAEGCNDPLEYHTDHTENIAYAPELAPQEGDFYIRKWVYSGFHADMAESIAAQPARRHAFLCRLQRGQRPPMHNAGGALGWVSHRAPARLSHRRPYTRGRT